MTNSSTDSTTSSTTASTTTSAPKKYSILDLFSSWRLARVTSMIYFIWFANSLTYYGLSLNTNDFVGDPFVNFFLLGAVEVPAYLACMYVVKRFGHKKTLLVTMVGAGLGCLAAISINCKCLKCFDNLCSELQSSPLQTTTTLELSLQWRESSA